MAPPTSWLQLDASVQSCWWGSRVGQHPWLIGHVTFCAFGAPPPLRHCPVQIADERTVIYPTIINAGVKTVILNGEADTCVPITDNQVRETNSPRWCPVRLAPRRSLLLHRPPARPSQWWTSSMGIPVVSPWAPWTTTAGSVGGYVTQYAKNFTFITVRGAGHMVRGRTPP